MIRRGGKGNGSLYRFWQVIVVVPRWLNEEGSFGGPVIDSGYRLSPCEIRFAMELLPLLLLCLLIAQPTAYSLSIKSKLNPRIVQTRYGEVQGLIRSFENAKFLKPIDVYLGIPYATPPVGSNRFSPTRAPSPWEGVRLSDSVGPVCPQKLPNISIEQEALERMPKGRLEYLRRLLPHLRNQSEDCLYLNIYAPAMGRKENKRETRWDEFNETLGTRNHSRPWRHPKNALCVFARGDPLPSFVFRSNHFYPHPVSRHARSRFDNETSKGKCKPETDAKREAKRATSTRVKVFGSLLPLQRLWNTKAPIARSIWN
ncbi:hypothetical protein HZH68_008934 [Vespula germanica]|uniref:Carboxylesterase type B domain-containing protein n=1 Tax=Vespula germanica TaxID=30212 RepID=A0A834N668_VESGE|nr:hypothetical protein HZH68_008934 [Vespula germanica]